MGGQQAKVYPEFVYYYAVWMCDGTVESFTHTHTYTLTHTHVVCRCLAIFVVISASTIPTILIPRS